MERPFAERARKYLIDGVSVSLSLYRAINKFNIKLYYIISERVRWKVTCVTSTSKKLSGLVRVNLFSLFYFILFFLFFVFLFFCRIYIYIFLFILHRDWINVWRTIRSQNNRRCIIYIFNCRSVYLTANCMYITHIILSLLFSICLHIYINIYLRMCIHGRVRSALASVETAPSKGTHIPGLTRVYNE